MVIDDKPSKPADDDQLMTFEMDKPKRAPPKGIGQKPKKKVAEDEEMKDESKPAAAAKAPPNIGKKPAAAEKKATTTVTKAPTAAVVQEEDLGAGLSKEDAIDKVGEFFSSGTVKGFEEAKW